MKFHAVCVWALALGCALAPSAEGARRRRRSNVVPSCSGKELLGKPKKQGCSADQLSTYIETVVSEMVAEKNTAFNMAMDDLEVEFAAASASLEAKMLNLNQTVQVNMTVIGNAVNTERFAAVAVEESLEVEASQLNSDVALQADALAAGVAAILDGAERDFMELNGTIASIQRNSSATFNEVDNRGARINQRNYENLNRASNTVTQEQQHLGNTVEGDYATLLEKINNKTFDFTEHVNSTDDARSLDLYTKILELNATRDETFDNITEFLDLMYEHFGNLTNQTEQLQLEAARNGQLFREIDRSFSDIQEDTEVIYMMGGYRFPQGLENNSYILFDPVGYQEYIPDFVRVKDEHAFRYAALAQAGPNRVIVAGGEVSYGDGLSEPTADVYFSVGNGLIPAMGLQHARMGASAAFFEAADGESDSCLYVVGGKGTSATSMATLEQFEVSYNEGDGLGGSGWFIGPSEVRSLSTSLAFAGSVKIGNTLYMIGGRGEGVGDDDDYRSVHQLVTGATSPCSYSFEKQTHLKLNHRRRHATVAHFGDSVLVIGGVQGTSTIVDYVEVISTLDLVAGFPDSFTTITPLPQPRAAAPALVTPQYGLCIYGGYHFSFNSVHDDIICVQPDIVNPFIYNTVGSLPIARAGHTMFKLHPLSQNRVDSFVPSNSNPDIV